MQRAPVPPLAPFVGVLWANEGLPGAQGSLREHALPTGAMHLVLRASSQALRIVDPDGDPAGRILTGPAVGGARSRYYLWEGAAPQWTVGAVLRPGAAQALFGVPASELAGQHTLLADLWGELATQHLHDRLGEAANSAARLALLEAALLEAALLEAALLARAALVHAMHPAIAAALGALHGGAPVHDAVRTSGLSHRRFGTLFQRELGLGPKAYSRVWRFQRVLAALRAPGSDWALADLAAWAGYSDQAHLNRDFVEIAGVPPGAYRRAAPAERNHLPVAATRGSSIRSRAALRTP